MEFLMYHDLPATSLKIMSRYVINVSSRSEWRFLFVNELWRRLNGEVEHEDLRSNEFVIVK